MKKVFTKTCGKCPECGVSLDAHTIAAHVGGKDEVRGPRAGDVLLCWSCAAILEMTTDDVWEHVRPEDLPTRYTFTETAVLVAVRNNLVRDIERRRAALN